MSTTARQRARRRAHHEVHRVRVPVEGVRARTQLRCSCDWKTPVTSRGEAERALKEHRRRAVMEVDIGQG